LGLYYRDNKIKLTTFFRSGQFLANRTDARNMMSY